MTQTIDLRKKEPVVPTPPHSEPELEPVAEEVLAEQPTAEAGIISWQAMINRTPPMQNSWYVAVGLFAIGAVTLFFYHNILLGIALALIGVVLLLKAHYPASHAQVRIDLHGVWINEDHYPYHEIGSFWLDYQPPHVKELSLRFRKIQHTPLRIPLENASPLEIRAHMVQFIPEKQHERSLLDQVVRMLGF